MDANLTEELNATETAYRRAILDVAKAIVEDTEIKNVFQHTAEQIARIVGVKRVVIYQIHFHWNKDWRKCEIVAGTPPEEHGIGITDLLKDHPDIESVVNRQNAELIVQPLTDLRTAHFQKIIESRNIEQILYVPVTIENKILGVIVLDADEQKGFISKQEIVFCAEIGELIALTILRSQNLLDEFRDQIINSIADLGRTAELMLEAALATYECTQEACINTGNGTICAHREKMRESAPKILPYAVKIKKLAERIDRLIPVQLP